MTPMRVALLGGYPVSGVTTGGAEKVCHQLGRGLAQRAGCEVHHVCLAWDLRQDREFVDGPVTVHAIGCAGWLPPGVKQYLGPRRRAAETIRRIAADIAHVHSTLYTLFAMDAGVPTIVTVHGMYHREAGLRRGLRWWVSRFHLYYFKKILRRARYIISISPYAEQELRPYTDAEFTYIPNPVSPAFFDLDPARTEEGRVLYVGNFIRRKCMLGLIQAFRQVLCTHQTARLRLVGAPLEPDYYREMRRYEARERLEGAVTFLGALGEQEGLLDEFGRASFLALMTRQETAPVVIAEAMAAGKAVVSNRICGIPYMVEDGVTGLLAEVGDTNGFVARLNRLLDDPALCREMGRRGREKALREFHPDRVVDATVALYRRVIEQWRR